MGPNQKVVGANAERSRSHNRQMVLDRVRLAGRIGRAEVARGTGLSTQAVSNIIADLLSDGLIRECGRLASARGQPPVQYGLNPAGGYAVGVEIRPDAIFAAVLDLTGAPVATSRQALRAGDLRGVTEAVRGATTAILKSARVPEERALGVGIVMPGPFGRTGLSETGSALPIFQEVAPAEWFSQALGLPVVVENDANAAAVAERVAGVARGLESYAYLYFGNGLGLGIVEQGRLFAGAFGNSGEIGHVPVMAGGHSVPLESVLSRLSVQRYMQEGGASIDSSEGLAAAFASRDARLMAWLERAAEPLSNAITIIENVLDPEAIILGGAMPDAIFDHLIAHAVLAEQSVAQRPNRSAPRLLRGHSGPLTGTLGAAALVINRAFTPRIAAAT